MVFQTFGKVKAEVSLIDLPVNSGKDTQTKNNVYNFLRGTKYKMSPSVCFSGQDLFFFRTCEQPSVFSIQCNRKSLIWAQQHSRLHTQYKKQHDMTNVYSAVLLSTVVSMWLLIQYLQIRLHSKITYHIYLYRDTGRFSCQTNVEKSP